MMVKPTCPRCWDNGFKHGMDLVQICPERGYRLNIGRYCRKCGLQILFDTEHLPGRAAKKKRMRMTTYKKRKEMKEPELKVQILGPGKKT